MASHPASRTPEEGLRRIRALVAVAVIGAIVLGVAGALLAVRAYGNAKDDEVGRLETSAAVASGDYAQFLRSRLLILQTLATSDTIVGSDAAGIQRRLARLQTQRLSLTEGVTWFDMDGVARASAGAQLELGAPADGELKRLMAAARAGDAPQTSGSIERSPYAEPVVGLVVPTHDAAGDVNGTLVGAVGTAYLNARTLLRRAVRGGDTLILDRNGNLFVGPGVRTSRPEGDLPVIRRIRLSPTRPVDDAVVGSLVGVTDPLGRRDQVLGFAVEPATSGWTFLIARSEHAAFADATNTLRVELAVLALLVALGIGGAIVLGRRLTVQYRAARAAEDRTHRMQRMTAGLAAASTPDAVARVVLELGQDATGADAGSIALLDAERGVFRTLAMFGYSDEVGEAFGTYPADARLPLAEALRDGPVWLHGADEVRQRYPELARFHATMSHEAVAALPLEIEGGAIGGLAFSFPERRGFGDEERAFLTSVAELSAQALDRARLYEAEQRKVARQQMLAEAGVMLDTPLDARATLTALADLCVPRIADWCSVSILADDGIEMVAVAHADPTRVAEVREYVERFPSRPDDDGGVAAVLRTGRSEFVPEVTGAMIDAALPPGEQRDMVQRLGLASVMTIPLVARGRILGALSLASAESRHRFTRDELAFAEDLGARAGLAIDNAMLLDRTRDIARTLQDSLLPSQLPEIAGLDVAARYVAGGEGVEVGGDFYDLFPLSQGRGWAAVLGDVCGKGTEAAALTALARHTIRAESEDLHPSEVLGRLNRAVLRESSDSRFLTATYAWLRPNGAGLAGKLARGGHPPSLVLRADGSVETLCPRGPLLGIMDDISFAESAFALGPGDALVLFSDGVVEARSESGEFFGLDRLIALVASLASRPAEEVAEELEATLERFGGPGGRDDRAILVLRVTEEVAAQV